MKTLVKSQCDLLAAGRCDIDYHSPAELLRAFDAAICVRVDSVASVVKTKRDPSLEPDEVFIYVDIAAIDVAVGRVVNDQEVLGVDAPSRARKVIRTDDVIVSTCRPTRGAVALVPERLDGQICSTAFSVLRASPRVLPAYLHFAVRLPSTFEQFRKWSTGSSYPAILDEDVAKTLIPVPADLTLQREMVDRLRTALAERDGLIDQANRRWEHAMAEQTRRISR